MSYRYAVAMPGTTLVITSELSFHAYVESVHKIITEKGSYLFVSDDNNIAVIFNPSVGVLNILTMAKFEEIKKEMRYAQLTSGGKGHRQ